MSMFEEAPRAVWWWGTTQLLPGPLVVVVVVFSLVPEGWEVCRCFFSFAGAAPFLSPPPPSQHTRARARERAAFTTVCDEQEGGFCTVCEAREALECTLEGRTEWW